jgi:1,3-beta-glucan synthase
MSNPAQGGHYDQGYGHPQEGTDSYYHDEQAQGYYDHNQGGEHYDHNAAGYDHNQPAAAHGGDGYYDES